MSGNPGSASPGSGMSGTPPAGAGTAGAPTVSTLPPRPKTSRTPLLVAIIVVVVVIAAVLGYGAYALHWFGGGSTTCGGSTGFTTGITSTQSLAGAGSTFVAPLMVQWTSGFSQNTSSCIQVTYNSVGSGAGISQLTAKQVEFGASDAPLSPAQRGALPAPALTLVDTVGGVVVMFNNGLSTGLHLNGTVVAGIYLGTITHWNDPTIAALNPTKTLPSTAIVVVHRSDSSGTTYQFTHWLSLDNATWKAKVGYATSVAWPTGIGEKGSAAVAAEVEGTTGAVGYVEQNYAGSTIQYAAIENPAGTFVLPSTANISVAANAVAPSLPAPTGDWGNVTLLNQAGTDTYPISTWSYIMVYTDLGTAYGSSVTKEQAQALVNFLSWVVGVSTGQSLSTALEYVPLPASVSADGLTAIGEIQYHGANLQTP